jgi:hypothetical protein
MKINPRYLGFHWRGRNKQGVSKWTGSIKPLYWIGSIFGIYGPIAAVLGIAAFLYALIFAQLSGPAMVLAGVGLLHGVIFTSIGQWALGMRRHILRLKPAEEVAAQHGVDAATLRELAEQRNIKPRMILNDQPYYDPTEFVDALSLLRAGSAPPTDPASLLHPVTGSTENRGDELLRASPGTRAAQSEEVGVDVQRLGR